MNEESLQVIDTEIILENCLFLEKNLNASRPSEHPPVRGENVKTFRWDHRCCDTLVSASRTLR